MPRTASIQIFSSRGDSIARSGISPVPANGFHQKKHAEACFFRGGPEEIRTLDLSDANRTLSQLSYRPNSNCVIIISRSFFNCNTFFEVIFVIFHFPQKRSGERRYRPVRGKPRRDAAAASFGGFGGFYTFVHILHLLVYFRNFVGAFKHFFVYPGRQP